MPSDNRIDRRRFLGAAAAAAAWSIVPSHVLGGPGRVAPSDRINIGYIGMGTQGLRELPRALREDDLAVTAVCDPNEDSTDYVDWSRHGLRDTIRRFLDMPDWGAGDRGIRAGREVGRRVVETHYGRNKPSGRWSGCRGYADFRELLAEESGLDAVKIMTPDHLHGPVAIAAMEAGLHVMMHKPVANVMHEVRRTVDTARRTGAATHLLAWSDGHSMPIIKAWIDSGAIGRLREVHNWIDKPIWPQWQRRPADTPPVPDGLDWDLWLGPVPHIPYHPNYTHAVFRGWYDFGTGILGDMGHYSLMPVFMAFGLNAPREVEATPSFTCEVVDGVSGKVRNDVAFPLSSTIRFRFPDAQDGKGLDLLWYDGGIRPFAPDAVEAAGVDLPRAGMMYVGDEGVILGDFHCNEPRIFPISRMRRFGDAKGGDIFAGGSWIDAVRGGEPPTGRFENAEALAEAVCLAAVALRTGGKIVWDSESRKIANDEAANRYLRREYRPGWEM